MLKVFSLLIFCLSVLHPVPCERVRHLEECVSQHSVECVVSAALAGSACAALISSKHCWIQGWRAPNEGLFICSCPVEIWTIMRQMYDTHWCHIHLVSYPYLCLESHCVVFFFCTVHCN